MTCWTVHTTWRTRGTDTAEIRPDWPTARRKAMQLACLAGTLYVSVQDPTDVVAGEWDRWTNRWREYPAPAPAGTTGGDR
jgi:hypothetical protein